MSFFGHCNNRKGWHSPCILVGKDPLLTFLLVYVPSILTLRYMYLIPKYPLIPPKNVITKKHRIETPNLEAREIICLFKVIGSVHIQYIYIIMHGSFGFTFGFMLGELFVYFRGHDFGCQNVDCKAKGDAWAWW